jgi:hypothetical protein
VHGDEVGLVRLTGPFIYSADFQMDAKSRIIAQVFSDAFTVYSAKKVSRGDIRTNANASANANVPFLLY